MKLKHIIGLVYHFTFKKYREWWRLRMNRKNPKKVISDVFLKMGRTMDWENPTTLDEKIQWLKFNSDTDVWARLSDKYKVREYVQECGLGELLIPLIGKWNRVYDIDWESLPNSFIMKTNHGSGDSMICTNKKEIDISDWKYHFILASNKTYGLNNCEMHYSKIKPCIIAEELLDVNKQSISTSSLIDYKVWCVNSELKYIWTCFDRVSDSVQVMMYDTQWNAVPQKCVETSHYRMSTKIAPPPHSLHQMIAAAHILAKGFPIVRVDFYEVDKKLYFGEMTFTSAGGFNDFYSDEFQKEIGEQINLHI